MYTPTTYTPIGLDKTRQIIDYINTGAITRNVIWKNSSKVRAIIQANPFTEQQIKRQIEFFLNSCQKLFFGESNHFSFTLGHGGALLMETNITEEQKSLIEEKIDLIEKVGLSRGAVELFPHIFH